MASIATCPESEKKKFANVLSNVTAEMLESNYSIKVLPHMKDYRVVIQDFRYEKAIIGADKITKKSKFIFYDPDLKNKRDQDGYIKFYDVKGEIIESIEVKHIIDIADCKKLKILKEKAYKEKAIPAKYSKDELEKEMRRSSKNKLIQPKKYKAHHIKICSKNSNKDKAVVDEFIGITLFNAALKKAGLYKDTTEYTIVKDESGKLYFDSTDARDDESWKYIGYRKILKYSSGIIQDIEHSECIDFNLLKATIIAEILGAFDIGIVDERSDECDRYVSLRNVLQFIDDKDNYHTKYIDLACILSFNHILNFNELIMKSWYLGYGSNKEKFNSKECKDMIFDAFRAVIELDVIGELNAIKPILNITGDSYDIAEISESITHKINSSFNKLKILSDIYVDPLYKKEWQEFCDKTNFNSEAGKLADELKSKYDKKQSTSLAAATGSETIDTTSKYICGNII